MTTYADVWSGTLSGFLTRCRNLSRTERALLSLAFAFLTGVSAQVALRLPFTPVPLTGQVFVVLVSGLVLGSRFGALSQILYLAGGSMGLGWFSAASGGLFRPTGGYILGFVLAAYMAGRAGEKLRTVTGRCFAMLAAVGVIYVCGLIGLVAFLRISPVRALAIGAAPFFPFDILKAYLAASLSLLTRTRGTNDKV